MELDKDTLKYLKMFAMPEVTSYYFLKGFLAKLFLDGITVIYNDLHTFFYVFCQKHKDCPFGFKNNGVFNYTEDIEDALMMLFNTGLIRKGTGEKASLLYLEFTERIAKECLREINNLLYVSMIESAAEEFHSSSNNVLVL